MFVFSRKKLGFRNPNTGDILTVKAMDVADLPAWVEADPMYIWALDEGAISLNTAAVDGPDASPDASSGYEKFSKAELIAMGLDLKLKLSDKVKKEELVAAIKSAKGE